MQTQDKDNSPDDAPARGEAKKLGLSKIIYGLGMSARDAFVAFAVTTVALFPIIYNFQGKSKAVDTIAKAPEKIHSAWKGIFKDKAGKAGVALGASFGIGSLVGYIAHLPGLIRGPRKVREAEERFNDEVEDNQRMAKEIKSLTETVKRQGIDLTEARMQSPEFAKKFQETPDSPILPAAAADSPTGEDFAARFPQPAASNAEKLLAQRTVAGEQTRSQGA